MAKITIRDAPIIIAAIFSIVVFLIGEVWVEYRLSNQEFGIFLVLCIFVAVIYTALFQDGEPPGRVAPSTIAAIGAASVAIFAISNLGFGLGFCNKMSWTDFLLFRQLDFVACSVPLSVSYGSAASAVLLILWNGLASVYRALTNIGRFGTGNRSRPTIRSRRRRR